MVCRTETIMTFMRFSCRTVPIRRSPAALLAVVLAACSAEEARSPADRAAARHGIADLVFFNGEILTLDPRMPRVGAMAVRQGRIIALGEEADIEPLTDAATRLEDLEGRTLIPGLMDARDPDAGRAAPPCREPEMGEPMAQVADARQPVFTDADLQHHAGVGVVALRLPKAQVDRLPELLARERVSPSVFHLRVAHWPACGARQRLLLQQVMRELAQAPAGSQLRISLDPEPAVIQPPPVPDAAVTPASGVPVASPGNPPAEQAALPASDVPVTLASPWQDIAATMRDASAVGATAALPALRGFTADAAPALGLDHDSGVLSVGKRADAVVLDRNPLREPPERVAGTVVLQTWIGGERVYQRASGDDPGAPFSAPPVAPTQNP